MLLPLFYYLVAFFIYVLLYEYYRNTLRKKSVKSDFLESLDSTQFNLVPTSHRKPFDEIKKELSLNFYFNHIKIIFGIDLSASNEWQGRKTFNGQSLHKTHGNKIFNPYQKAINQLGPVFEEIFSSKVEYSSFGFGDQYTKDFAFFPIAGSGEEFHNYNRILDAYLEQTKNIVFSGPTAFTPIIYKLISYGIHCRKDFTMLIILTDELKISHEDKTLVEAIRLLTSLPNVCLIIIGVGDGPWQRMSHEEHRLRELAVRKKNFKNYLTQLNVSYDNFHFVDFNAFQLKLDKTQNENHFARAVLRKLPTQFKRAFQYNQNTAFF